MTDLLNPKTALFSIGFLPQFIDPRSGSVAVQFAILGAVFVAAEVAVDGIVGVQAGRLSAVLHARVVDVIAGMVLLSLALAVAFAH